jgi:hypothetical protein
MDKDTSITVTEIKKEGFNNESFDEKARLYKWQNKLLPFLVIVPSLLAVVFIVLATIQVTGFTEAINKKESIGFIGTVIPRPNQLADSNNVPYIKWLTLVHMEEQSLDNRYKQAGFLLMSRVLTKYLGFFTGMIMAIVGAAFIIAKLSEKKTTMDGSVTDQLKFNIGSSSPGILFGFLGTVLMITTIVSQTEINVKDQPLYLNANTIQVADKIETPADTNNNELDSNLVNELEKVEH